MRKRLTESVGHRAMHRCEYCQMPQALDDLPFQIDHVTARQHGGPTAIGNLALSCVHCNSHKGPNLAGIDPHTGRMVRLFNPRRQIWAAHFMWHGAELMGLTPTGRATVAVLAINDPDYIAMRAALIEEGVFPADEK